MSTEWFFLLNIQHDPYVVLELMECESRQGPLCLFSQVCNIRFPTTASANGLVLTAQRSGMKSWWDLQGNLVDEQGGEAAQHKYFEAVLLYVTQALPSADQKTKAFIIPTGQGNL